MKLDPIKDIKIEHKVSVEKKQEFKIIGRTINKRGMFIFAYDPDKKEVYKLDIQKRKTINFKRKDASYKRAFVNPKHKMLWAINKKNAERKFKKLLNL